MTLFGLNSLPFASYHHSTFERIEPYPHVNAAGKGKRVAVVGSWVRATWEQSSVVALPFHWRQVARWNCEHVQCGTVHVVLV